MGIGSERDKTNPHVPSPHAQQGMHTKCHNVLEPMKHVLQNAQQCIQPKKKLVKHNGRLMHNKVLDAPFKN